MPPPTAEQVEPQYDPAWFPLIVLLLMISAPEL